MKPTLNQADIELLKGVFVTKDDLNAMEARFIARFATKDEVNSRFDVLESILAKSFEIIEARLSKLEHILNVKPAN